MMLNVIFLAALADRVAAHVSAEAARWPVSAKGRRAIPVQWVAGDSGGETRQLVEALKARTQAPYRAVDRADAVAIVTEGEHEPALAVVTVWRAGCGDGFRCEVDFPRTP